MNDAWIVFFRPVSKENPGYLIHTQLAVKFIFVWFSNESAEAGKDFRSQPDIDRSPVNCTAVESGEDAFVGIHNILRWDFANAKQLRAK